MSLNILNMFAKPTQKKLQILDRYLDVIKTSLEKI